MEQDELIESIENPSGNEVAPLPEDLLLKKEKKSFVEIVNLASYITLGVSALFILILFILGLLR